MTNVEQFDFQNATYEDLPLIRQLQSQNSKFIGPSKRNIIDPFVFMEDYTTHRILARVKPTDDTIVGYAEFRNYPRLYALDVDSWTDWLHHLFCVNCSMPADKTPITVSNTLFLCYFVYNPAHFPDLFAVLLREIFFRERKLRYILSLERPYFPHKFPEDEPCYDIFRQFGTIYYPKVFHVRSCKNTQQLHVIHRDEIIAKMRYRRALPEDNDDVVNVVDVDIPELKAQFGEFYVAEELLNPDPHKALIITEVDNETIGFFWLNDNVDIMTLIKNYELEPYGNLIKFTPHERVRKSVVHVNEIDRKHPATLFTTFAIVEILEGRKSIPICIEQEDWSSYASLETFTEVDTYPESRINYANFEGLKDCILRLQKLNDILRSTEYYFTYSAKPMRIYYNASHPMHSNVFAMQLVGLDKCCDFREVFRFLMAAFSTHQDRDYCIFSKPIAWKMTPAFSQLLRYFIPVLPRPGCEIDDELYIAHRSCLYGDVVIQKLHEKDIKAIEQLLFYAEIVKPLTSDASVQTDMPPSEDDVAENQKKSEVESVHEIMYEVLRDPWSEFQFLTIRVGNSAKPMDESIVIGFVIVRQFNDRHLLRHNFHLTASNEILKYVRGEIVTLRLHPLYRFESDLIFREVARLSGFWDFYYFAPTKYQKPFTNDLVTRMEPIEPKRIKKQYRPPRKHRLSGQRDPRKPLYLATDRFAAYRQNLLVSKFFGSNKSTVIIGFNALCKAYLRVRIFEWNTLELKNPEKFCCIPHLNITVITKPGVAEAELDTHFRCESCRNQDLCWVNWQNYDSFVRDVTLRMDLTKYIKFVNGNIKSINRQKKVIVMQNDCEISYDDLILIAESEHGLPPHKSPEYQWPSNYQHINNRFDRILMYYKLRALKGKFCEDADIKFLVYGRHLRTFEFINFLVKHGIPGAAITLVLYVSKPIDEELRLNNAFHDLRIELILQEMAEDLGVKVHENYMFSHWLLHEEDNAIKSAVFESPSSKDAVLTLDCDMFVSYYETDLDVEFARIIEDAGVTMKNGNVQISFDFRTNDRVIFAAGKSTVSEFEVNQQYTFVDPKEQAQKLLKAMTADSSSASGFDSKYHEPNYCAVQLPFNYYMVKIILPKLYLANHLHNEYSHSLITYHDYEFCRVRLNPFNVVEEIVCITQKDCNLDFLKFFCGKHEQLLNNLKSRWYVHSFASFLEFFKEPWSELVQHERFHELCEQNRQLIAETAENILLFQKDLDRKVRQQLLHKTLNDLGMKEEVEANLIRFLRKYRDDFYHPFALPEDFITAGDMSFFN